VIIFDRMWSLTEFVQSRGRARHKHSQYLVYASAEEKCFYESLVNTEHKLVNILKQMTIGQKTIDGQSWTSKCLDLIALVKTCEKKEEIIVREKKKFVRGKKRKHRFFFIVYLNETKLDEFYPLIKSCKGYSKSEQLNSTNIQKNQDLHLDYLEQTNAIKCYFELANESNENNDENEQSKTVLQTVNYLLGQKRMLIHVFEPRTKILTN